MKRAPKHAVKKAAKSRSVRPAAPPRPVPIPFDPELDLQFERVVDVAPQDIYDAWTKPALIVKWFTPAPWKTIAAKTDLRPGGVFHNVMQSPDGQQFPNTGSFLELIPGRRIVWTGALGPGFRPRSQATLPPGAFVFTAVITLTPKGKGTRYHAHLMHTDAEGRKVHEGMGFEAGWNAALDQLVAMVHARRRRYGRLAP